MGILDRFRSVELDDIAAARASYLEIAEASTRRSRESSEALEAETVLRLPPGSGFLHDLLRLDYGSTNGREACIGYVHTRPVKLRGILKDRSFGNVSLSGFDWAGARFEVTGPLQAAAALSDWARTWLKDPGPEGSSASIRELRRLVKARHAAAAEGAPEPAGAIHAVRIFDDASFAVDFGSAPLAAFTGLLESLDRAGAFEIRIGAERKRHEIFQDEVADLLGRIHAADLEARRGRDLPGEFRAWFAAAAEGLAARCRTADPDARTQVREDIEARVAEIDDRIICMLERDGEDALHLRFGSDGWIDLVSEIRGLVAGWTPPEGWRIGAFQPPRPWTDVTALAPLRFGARVEIDLRRVRATLTPRSCDVEVELEFEEFGRFTAEGLRAAAREILFEILGEETYLSAVGGVTVRMQRDDPGDSVPLSELAPAFDRCVAEVRRRLEALDAAGGRARVDMNLALLLDRLTAFQQVQKDYAAIARQHADAGEIDLALVFWIDGEAQERLLEDAFEDVQFCIEGSLSLRGAGHLLSAGACDGGRPGARRRPRGPRRRTGA